MILTLIAGTALALPESLPQEEEGLKISNYINVASLQMTHTFGMEFDSPGAGDLSFSNLGLFSLLGQYELPGGITWIPSVSYDLSQFNLDGPRTPATTLTPRLEDPLHQIAFPNFFIRQTDSQWLYGLMVSPSIHSSFDEVNSRDFFLSAGVGAAYRFSDSLLLGFGVYGVDLTNDPSIFVGPGFVWEIDENWTSYFYGPRFVTRRAMGDDRFIGVEAAWNGGEWSTNYAGQDAKIDFNSTRAGLIFRQRLSGELWLDLAAGYSFGNELTITSPGGRQIITPGLGDAGGSPYVRVGLSLGTW